METTILEIVYTPPEVIESWVGGLLAGVGAAIGGISSIFGAKENRRAQRDANEANLELAKYQNQWNLEQWNRENAYNTPAEQMRRLKQAGINPNLAFSNGTIDNVSASSPTASPMKVEPYLGNTQDMQSMVANVMTGLQAFETYKQAQNQTKLGETQVDYLKADVLNKRAHTEKLFEEKMGLQYDNYVKRELRDYNIDMFKLQMDDARANISLKNAQTDVHRLSLSFTKKQMELIAEQIIKTKQEVANLKTTNEHTRELITREKLDNALRKQGINPSDPMLYRMLGQAIQNPDYGVELVKNLRTVGLEVTKQSVQSTFNYWEKLMHYLTPGNNPSAPHGWKTR